MVSTQIVRKLDQERYIGGVIERSVVELISLNRSPVPVAVKMRRYYNVLVLQDRVAPWQHCENIRRAVGALRGTRAHSQPRWNVERGQNLFVTTRPEDGCRILARAFQQRRKDFSAQPKYQ